MKIKNKFSFFILLLGLIFFLFRLFNSDYASFDNLFIGFLLLIFFNLFVSIPYILFYFVFSKINFIKKIHLFFGGILMILADLYFHYAWWDSGDGLIFAVSPFYLVAIVWFGFGLTWLFLKIFPKFSLFQTK